VFGAEGQKGIEMSQTWQQFLQQNEFNNKALITDLNEISDETKAMVCDLSAWTLIAVSGDDAADFLQNLLTNSAKELSPTEHQLSALCTPKGRMLATFRLFRHLDRFVLRVPAALAENLIKRLSMYVLRSAVTIRALSDEWGGFGLSGENATQLLQDALGENFAAQATCATAQGVALRIDEAGHRYELFGTTEFLTGIWTKLSVSAQPVSGELWRLLDIRAGIPTIFPETVEAFVPQMTNLQLVKGLSFTKGCYPGQEIIARMQYLGELKRRMYRLRLDADRQPLPGEELTTGSSSSGQWSGKIVDAQPSPLGGYELLAVLKIADVENGEFHLSDSSGPASEYLPLPYAYENTEQTS
jgi:folate-binding protein YgfZ